MTEVKQVKKDVDNDFIEIIPKEAQDYINNLEDNKIILSLEEIKNYNLKIEEKSDDIYDLNKSVYTKEEIISFINRYTVPSLPKYNGDMEIGKEMIQEILDNRNINNILDKVRGQKGLVIKRTNLRAFPTSMAFYDNVNDNNFDNIQETEVHVNSPVLVLCMSKNQKYVLVITKTYIGWINKDDVVLVNDEDYKYFTENSNFVIITAPYIKINNTILDMSVKLPFKNINNDSYEVVIPDKDSNNNLIKKSININKNNAHIGYLSYTKKNIYIQAFKYKGIPYSWGGKDFGVDCSSYVSNVYRTFGFEFPRNTGNQNSAIGKVISLESKSSIDKLNIIKDYAPNLLYENGHVLIYLGIKNNKHYVINATGNRNILKVAEEELDTSYHLDKINKLVMINTLDF